MTKELIILGTGAHAREMAEIVERINRLASTWKLLGFMTPEERAERPSDVDGYPVLGALMDLGRYPDAHVALEYGVPWPEWPRDRVATLIAPDAFVSRTARIGAGCVIYPNCFVGANAVLGDQVFMLSGSVVNHDDCLEDRVTLCSGVTLAGFVHVESGVYLGQACTVREGLRVGRGSLVGMGSVVVADVPAGCVVAGNPARRLRDREGFSKQT